MKPYVIVANWKMYFSHQEAIAWAQAHFPQLASLLARSIASAQRTMRPQGIAMHFIKKIIFLSMLASSGNSFAAERPQSVHEIMLEFAKRSLTKQQATVIVKDLQRYRINLNEQKNPRQAKALVRRRASPHIEDNDRYTLIEIARKKHFYALADDLGSVDFYKG